MGTLRDGHRKDIDGLRAVAILPVLFYHANIWPFSGGYVGVDVFFVLSGYLITGLILREQTAAGFSLVDFYDRRARRILPALAVVLVFATLAAAIVLLPDELEQFGGSLAGAVLFYANILYWLRDTAYFAPDASQNPLLHVWSLSVEEQFYLFWPPLLIVLARVRRALPAAILLLAAGSLALALYYASVNPVVSFYLLPMRAWQLLAGAFLAAVSLAPLRAALARNAVALTGLGLIIAAALIPGAGAGYHAANALAAALGAAAILFAANSGANVVSAVLSTRVPVFIGRISYSLYLWHWPALVFARLYLNRELSLAESVAVLLAAFAASVLSWKYIEQPIRRRALAWRSLPLSFAVAAAGAALLSSIALVLVLSGGLPGRVRADIRAIDAQASAPLAGRWCGVADGCVQGSASDGHEAVLWGDSHARALAPGLSGFVQSRHLRLRQFTRMACPPLPGLDVAAPNGAPYPVCAAFDRAALAAILSAGNIRLVILEARWEVFLNEARISPANTAPAAMAVALDQLLAALTRRGIAVLIVGNIPPFADVPAHCYGRARLLGRDTSHCTTLPLAAASATIGVSDALIARAAARYPAVRAYLPQAVLCGGAVCHAFAAGRLLYGDGNHLSWAGAQYVGGALDRALPNWPG